MRTVSPIPSFGDFRKLFFPKSAKDTGAFERALKHKRDHAIFWTQRTRHSIFLISKWHTQKFGMQPIFFVPDYFCHDALDLLDQAQMKIYRVNELLQPDLLDCSQKLSSGRVDYFILPHYFGNKNSVHEVKDFCTRHDIFLIEDCAHVFKPNNGIGEVGDLALYSSHKFLPISDGAAVVVHHKSKLVQHGLSEYLAQNVTPTSGIPVGWSAKKLIQRILRLNSRVKTGAFAPFETQISEKENIDTKQLGISKFAFQYIQNISPNEIEEIESRRLENLVAWKKYFQGLSTNFGFSVKILNQLPFTPYVCAIECDRAEQVFDLLARANLCPQPWPNLDSSIVNRTANRLREKIILLPLHHDWEVAALAQNYSKMLLHFSSKIELNSTENFPEDVSHLQQTASLLQTKAYVNAKKTVEGKASHQFFVGNWPSGRGYLICKVKKIGPLRIFFMNRGPVVQNGDDFLQFAIMSAFLKRFSIWRLNLVLFQPEIDDSKFSGLVAKKLRWIRAVRVLPVTHSSILDLSQSVEDLRKRLNSKWRNLLKKSEGQGIDVVIDSDGFQEFLSRYKEFRQEKSFGGIQNDFLSAYYDCCGQGQKPILMTAKKSSEWLGGIVVTQNFPNSVYLLSVNTPTGREACANYLLLWSAVCYLKEKKFMSFDLGGFDDINTPQITHFKRQIGGREYKLVGPFVKLI